MVLFPSSRSGILCLVGKPPLLYEETCPYSRSSSTLCRHHQSDSTATHPFFDKDSTELEPEPGVWHVHQTGDTNHVSLVPFWISSSRQKYFWIKLGHWLRSVDDQLTRRGMDTPDRHG